MKNIWACEQEFLIGWMEHKYNYVPEEKGQGFLLFGPPEEGEKEPIWSLDEDKSEATIKIDGPLSKEGPDAFDRAFGYGGTGYLDIVEAADEIKGNKNIKTIRLMMNTPGGEVAGVDEVWTAIKDLAKEKNVIAENHGMIASAGYWIASAADEIKAMSPVDETGSIGVVIIQLDMTERMKSYGVKRIKIVSRNAPNKNPDAGTKKGQETLQARADAVERVFISRIAEGRNTTEEDVIDNFGKGGLLIAEDPAESKPDALSVGMIDSVEAGRKKSKHKASVLALDEDTKKDDNDLVKDNIEDQQTAINQAGTAANHQAVNNQEEVKMDDLKKLMAENPHLKEEVEAIKLKAFEYGIQTVREQINEALPFLKSDAYPQKIKEMACDVIKGEKDLSVLTGAASIYDALKEETNAEAAAKETDQTGETRGTNADAVSTDGIIRTDEDIELAVAEMHRMGGV